MSGKNNNSNKDKDLAELYDTYADVLFKHCYFRVSDREAAKDLLQEIFVRYWKSAQGQSVSNPKALLFKIARNLIIDHYRKRKNESMLISEMAESGEDLMADLEQSDLTERQGFRLEVILRQLDEKYRELFVMRYLDQLSPQEIAKITGLPVNTVSVRIHRAVKIIKQTIESYE